ncbi:predicted protein [Chaetoceros tenuissimus]|uniref:Uncharacterized protein n=1 Tax=Chaetoceros tenuissimus TaxID=426638 RepID=A0AAD3CM68_9STRA|nr:predicted protein [Chaetoceros tenuissimus]
MDGHLSIFGFIVQSIITFFTAASHIQRTFERPFFRLNERKNQIQVILTKVKKVPEASSRYDCKRKGKITQDRLSQIAVAITSRKRVPVKMNALTRTARFALPRSNNLTQVRTKATHQFKADFDKKHWVSDPGAYPVMGIVAFACTFCTWRLIVSTGNQDLG